MKKLLFILLFFPLISFSAFTLEDLNLEVQKGEEILKKLKNQEINCQSLTDEDFESLGEYFMDLMIGNRETHLAMNQMMKSMHGEDGEKLMHINMGKRFSGCDQNSIISSFGIMPGGPMMGYGKIMPMTGYGMWAWNFLNWSGWNILGPILGIFWFLIIIALPILVLILLILLILNLIKKLKKSDN